jgi:hypothetical protein
MRTCKNGVQWLFKLDQEYCWQSSHPVAYDLRFIDKQGKTRMVYKQNGEIIIPSGYAWDGCTPKICFFDILIGTPDGVIHKDTEKAKTYYASLIHDSLYQFLPDLPKGIDLNRADADWFFLELMKQYDFAPRWLYWVAVRCLGGLFIRTRRWTRNTFGHVIIERTVESQIPAEQQISAITTETVELVQNPAE